MAMLNNQMVMDMNGIWLYILMVFKSLIDGGWSINESIYPGFPLDGWRDRNPVESKTVQEQQLEPEEATDWWILPEIPDLGMGQYLLYIPFLGEWTSIYQLFWGSPGVQGFDTLPFGNWHLFQIGLEMFHVQYFFHQFCQLRGRWYFLNPIHVAAHRQASFVMSELSKSTEGFQVLFEDMPEDPWSWCQRYGWRILGSVPAVCVRLRQLNELYKLYGYTQKTWTRSQTSCEEIPRFLLASCHLHDRVSTCLTSQSTQKSRLKLSNRQIIALCEIGHGFILAPKQSLDPPRATHLLKSAGPTSIWGPKFCPCRCHWKPEAWHFPGLHLPGSGSMAWGHSGSQCYPVGLGTTQRSAAAPQQRGLQVRQGGAGWGPVWRNWKELEGTGRNWSR